MLFLWFYFACWRGSPQFLMVADHINYLTFEDPGAVNTVRRALKLAHAGDLLGAAETAGVEVGHAAVVSEGLRRGMRFSIGAEVDNDPRSRPDAQNIVDALRPDGIIRSVHFVSIDHPDKGPDWPWAFDNEEFVDYFDLVGTERLWELYVAKLLDDVEKLPTHIVGHFYVPAKFGHWPAQKNLEAYEDRLIEVCHARGLAIEVNTRFLYRSDSEELKKQYLEANARLVRKAKARGVGIAIGSDAHSPKDQGRAFEAILRMLDEAHVNELIFPVGGRLARVALRATREHLEAHARTRESTAPGSSISGYSRAELGLPEESEKTAASRRESARAVRAASPKSRASDATRTPKRADASSAAPKSGAKARAPRPPKTEPKRPAATKTAPVRKADPKMPAAHKAPAKKAPAKKAPVKKAPAKKAPAPKASTKKAPPKKSAPRKSAAKGTAVKGTAVKAGRKAAVKKAPAKKPAVKRASKPAKPAARKPAKPAKKAASKKLPAKKKSAPKRR